MSASRPGRPLKSPAAIMRPYDPNVNPDCGFDFGGGCCSGLIVGGSSGACLTSGGCALGGGCTEGSVDGCAVGGGGGWVVSEGGGAGCADCAKARAEISASSTHERRTTPSHRVRTAADPTPNRLDSRRGQLRDRFTRRSFAVHLRNPLALRGMSVARAR